MKKVIYELKTLPIAVQNNKYSLFQAILLTVLSAVIICVVYRVGMPLAYTKYKN